MYAGSLKETIIFERPVDSKSEFGDSTIKWVTDRQTKASVEYSNLNRTTENDEIFFSADVIFRIRIYHKIQETMRIKWENRYYRILSIEKQRTQQQITIKTELINE
jgi:SPP1 family predicted phage head-tail adaptor